MHYLKSVIGVSKLEVILTLIREVGGRLNAEVKAAYFWVNNQVGNHKFFQEVL